VDAKGGENPLTEIDGDEVDAVVDVVEATFTG
jgi:hypothetical protein